MQGKRKIMISEESESLGREIAQSMEMVEVIYAPKDGVKMLERIRETSPDLVILNVFLPRLDGVGIMQASRRSERGEPPAFIMVSDFDSPILKREMMSAGAQAYFTKPVTAGSLAAKARKILKMKEMGNEDMLTAGKNNDDIEVRVTEILHQIGVPAHIKGYHYLRDAIMKSVNNPDIINAVTKQLYPSVAKRFETTSSRVERAIRHAIEVAWDRGDVDILNSYFGYTIHNSRGKPTNSEFVAMISDNLRLQLKNAS